MKKKPLIYIIICNSVAAILAAISLFDYIKKEDKFHIVTSGVCLFLFFTASIIFRLEYKKHSKSASKEDSLKSNLSDANIKDQTT